MRKLSFLITFLLLVPGAKAETCEQLQEKCKEMSDALEKANIETCEASRKVCAEAQKACANETRKQPKMRELLNSTTAHMSNIRKLCSQTTAAKE